MLRIEPMTIAHLDQVHEIELDSFAIPWTKESLRQEIAENKIAIYLVAIQTTVSEANDTTEEIVGYGGMWHVVTEGHITNIAVKPDHRGKGVGDLLVGAMVNIGREKEMLGITLEVRMGNKAAMGLYGKHGFKMEGIRKNYYADTKEDAVVMWLYF